MKKSNQIGISVKHDEKYDVFEVVIHLNEKDSLALKKITADVPTKGEPARILITADGGLVEEGYIYEPFDGNDFYVGGYTHEVAFDLTKKFVDKLEKQSK